MVPFQGTVKRQLRKYLMVRGELETPYLFVTLDNTQVSIRAFQDRMAEYGKKAGITNVRCSPHTARHTFAKMYIQNGGDAFSLQRILGHTTIDMTRVYVDLFSSDIKNAHKKVSPIERLF
jgi:integrase/recombinase XerD